MQGFSLADAIEGAAPGGVSKDGAEPPPKKCRFKGCPTMLCVQNRSGRRPPPKEEPEEAETASPEEPSLEESGVHESAPPDPAEPAPKPPAKRTKKEQKKIPTKDHLCNLHQRMVRDYEMGLRDWDQGREGLAPGFVPEYEDD